MASGFSAKEGRPERVLNSKLIIGIDFGTTYSGAVWAHSEKSDRLTSITDWPGSRSNNGHFRCQKVPTRIRYLDSSNFEWGAQVPSDADPHDVLSLFKLFLEPALALDATEAFGDISAPSNIDQVITDYLTGLFGHVMKTIESQLGSGVVARVALHVVLTVPAIWSDLAKQRTNQAFHNIPNLPSSLTTSLVSEPEAAAISALRELDGNSFQKAESFVVVDAGGGTVDLITYTIRSLYPILEVDEATEGTGACCGSSLVNLRFKRFLTAKLGNEPNWDKEVLCEALDRFEETTKRSISLAGVAHGEAYNISVSGLALNHGLGVTRNGRFSLRAVDLHMLFEPCILRIIQLVKEQITICHDPVRCILLVGGFGGSTYLRERLIQAIEEDETIRKPLEILQPPTAWLAVARGAAMKGIALVKPENHDLPVVMSRAARKHYGYELGVEYDPEIHASLDDQKYWCGYSGVWRVRVVSWFIKRGERVSEDAPFMKAGFYHWRVGDRNRPIFSIKIYADEISTQAPLIGSGQEKLLCSLNADLSAIPDNQLDQQRGEDGNMYFSVRFDIEAVYRSASTEYTMIHKGERHDTVIAEYV